MDEANMHCVACGNEYASRLRFCPDDQTILISVKADNRVGSILSERYEIIDVIKSGGMGTVYKARQLMINRVVAIKMLHQNMLMNNDALKRFRFEAQAASRLGAANILPIYDFGLTPEGQPFMVMPYLDGLSLEEVIAKESLVNALRVLDISIQICAAMSHAHSHGVLHRDIKPSNIMLVNDEDRVDFVKIVDFGIAKIMNEIGNPSCTITKTGQLYGSPAYMSPEQCYGVELDARSDIYSLGCVMYRALTGHNFFDSDGMLQTMQKHINDMPPPFSDLCPEIHLPHDLECAVLKALAKDPEDRFATMDQFKGQLQEIRQRMVAGETSPDESNTSSRVESGSSPADASYSSLDLDESLPVGKVIEPPSNFPPLTFVQLSLHAKKMAVVSLALSSAAMLAVLMLGTAGNLHKSQKEIGQFKQPHIFAAANAANAASAANVVNVVQSESKAAKGSFVVEKEPGAMKPSHKARVVRKHSQYAPIAVPFDAYTGYRDRSHEVHRHAYSSY
jgi:serine/threonine protein kinase